MKLSLKLQENSQTQNHQKQSQTHPLLLRAKIPISIFNLPFLSCFSTTTHHPSDLSLSLATSFPSGPTLKLAYSTASTPTTPSSTTPIAPPLTLTLKSGIGVFGSPKNSPLVISANFSFSPLNSNQNPTFTLLFKPQLGSFSLRKTTTSDLNSSSTSVGKQNGDGNSFGFVPLERPSSFKEFSMEDYAKDSVFKGIAVMAKTEMPLTNKVVMDCRWGVNFPKDLGSRMPFLSVNKIGIKRVEEVKEVKEKKDKNSRETELLKGMCFWMKNELEMLQRENREMKHRLEEMKMGNGVRKGVGEAEFVGVQVIENSGGFEQWRNKRNSGGENPKKEVKKNSSNGNRASDVESELQKAIRAASSS
ncbi:uncharacterized protein LOC107023372 [Solanum pennellii]|uniref:Uncharacterized protein LOC107023372 n=1 Tax=Solanum pennellii TaxID=28526 RepID=A0ABM1H2Q3_SOLPN|nr:uncharacterized protein LOC107023372 [Solanum pennellii]